MRAWLRRMWLWLIATKCPGCNDARAETGDDLAECNECWEGQV